MVLLGILISYSMSEINFIELLESLKHLKVERPNKTISSTLSGHAAGTPFEECVYEKLKEKYPENIFRQYEFLNNLYLLNPDCITVEQRHNLIKSPTIRILLNRGQSPTKKWSLNHPFKDKQDDTADSIYNKDGFYNIIDVKTRDISKDSRPPNIISSYKLARICASMIDNQEYDNLKIDYIQIDWTEDGDNLISTEAFHGELFKANPENLYINWAAAMQIQFHVCKLDQSWKGTREEWARNYLKAFISSAKERCEVMKEEYITPFKKYIV